MILQDIAGEVAMKKSVSFAPGTGSVSIVYTREGSCPDNGVHTPEGSVFIGSYRKDKWFSDSVTPYHEQIRNARNKNIPKGTGGPKKLKRQLQKIKRND